MQNVNNLSNISNQSFTSDTSNDSLGYQEHELFPIDMQM